jgi:hypothetical protein
VTDETETNPGDIDGVAAVNLDSVVRQRDELVREHAADTSEVPVTRIAGGFARGPGGLCAFCAGDACGEDSAPDSPIARFFAANPIAPSCPVCDGRPS